MGIKDQGLLEYLKDASRYADLMNGTIFQGKQVVEAKYLKTMPRKKRLFFCKDPGETRENDSSEPKIGCLERERDVLMLHDKVRCRFYLACEGEARPDYVMPVRCLTYDGVEYSQQIELETHPGQKGVSRPLIPVFHQVLYLGEKRWMSKHTLWEMMDIPMEMEEFRELLPNYQVHLTDIHDQNPELFRTEWKDIFQLMNHSRKSKELKEYIEKNREKIQGLSQETRRFLAILLDQYEIMENGEVEVKDVCEAWDGAMLLYKEEGMKAGIKEGISALILDNQEEGKSRETIIRKLRRRFSLSLSEAENYYALYSH